MICVVYKLIPGFGAAPLWSSKCAYLTTTAIAYAKNNNQDQDAVITRFFGIFFMIFQSAQVWGNLISSAVLQRSEKSSANSTNSSGYDVSDVCGANDCGAGIIMLLSYRNEIIVCLRFRV